MPIEMPKGLPFSVDTWTACSKKKRHHFLTHAHKDHSQGITTHFSYPIYSTHLTKTLILQHFPQLDDSLFVGIEVGQSMVINDPDGTFSVTAFDANHCPGAVMLLFEGNFGNILHTGDCRLTPECLQSLPEKYIGKKGKEPRAPLDYVFLDCTFGKSSLRIMPSKHSAIRQVINCIWKHPDAKVVYLTCDLLGQEEILVNVSQTFGSKIFVDKDNNSDYFRALTITAPDVISQDPLSRFHIFEGFPRLYERAKAKLTEAQANYQPDPLIIRPSAQWYACDDEFSETGRRREVRTNEAVRDQFGVWHMCYSMHSSKEELEWALQLLAPKRVVSTTPTCRAMELDYVKKHCIGTKLALDDPLWKLLDINLGTSKKSDESSIKDAPLEEGGPTKTTTDPLPPQSPVKMSVAQNQWVVVSSPPSKSPPITLFGRARLGFADFTSPRKEIEPIRDDQVSNEVDQDFLFEEDDDVVELKCGKSLENKVDDTEIQDGVKSVVKEANDCKNSSYSPVESSSKSFNESFRKFYRSMNVPVPQPLPSLVELINANKRAKRRF